jgi:hypothetical protein
VKILPFIMTWAGLVTKHNKKHRNEIEILNKTEAYIQSLVSKKTLENKNCLYFEYIDSHNKVDALVNKIAEALTEVKFVDIQYLLSYPIVCNLIIIKSTM